MIKETNNKKRHIGQGFVEALIAILVAGIACIVLLMVASKTVKQMNDNELRDDLNRKAIYGSEMVKFLVDSYVIDTPRGGIDTLLPLTIAQDRNKCVAVNGDISNPSISSIDSPVCLYNNNGIRPADCTASNITIVNPDDGADMYRVMCVMPDSTPSQLIVKFFTGFKFCNDADQYINFGNQGSTDCVVYEYTSVYSTIQSLPE